MGQAGEDIHTAWRRIVIGLEWHVTNATGLETPAQCRRAHVSMDSLDGLDPTSGHSRHAIAIWRVFLFLLPV